jgi:hypothetical protein
MLIRKSTSARIPVRLIDTNGDAVLGVAASGVWDGTTAGSITVVKSSGAIVTFALTNGVTWIEVHATKFPGLYHIVLPNTLTDVVGGLQVAVLPNGSTFVATVVSVEVESIATNVEKVSKITSNNWTIQTTGGDANRLVIFDDDGVTPLYKFDLKDSTGAPTSTTPFRRARVGGF